MKTQKFSFGLVLIVSIFLACQEEEAKTMPEPGYPTTYSPLSAVDWEARNAEFQKIKKHDGLYLDEYGFLAGNFKYEERDSLNAKYVIEIVEKIISLYKTELGIPSNIEIDVENLLMSPDLRSGHGLQTNVFGYFESLEYFNEKNKTQTHYLYIPQKEINSKKLSFTRLNLVFDEIQRKCKISGGWYPEALIPKQNVISEGQAYAILYQFYKTQFDVDIWETKYSFRLDKVIIPVKIEGNIGMYYCWHFSIPLRVNEGLVFSSREIYIDTQNGEIRHFYIKQFYPL